MIRILRIFCLLIVITVVFSCHKDHGPAIEPDKLTACNWYLHKMEIIVRNPIAPIYNVDSVIYPKDCEKDDYLKFMSDSTFINYFGSIKCVTNEQDTASGTFSLNTVNLTLAMNSNLTGKNTYKIYELDLSNLILINEIAIDVKSGNNTVTIRSKKTYYYQNK